MTRDGEDRQDFAEDWREDRQDLWEDVYEDHHYWGDWDDDSGWVWGLVGGAIGFAIGAKAVTVGGVEYLQLGSVHYRHYIAGDDEVFVVAKA